MGTMRHTGSGDLFGEEYEVCFTSDELHAIRRPIEGSELPRSQRVWGGNQNLAFLIQEREHYGRGRYTDSEISDAFYKALAYGNGTWQKYFSALVSAAGRAGWRAAQSLVEKADEKRRDVLSRRRSWA